MGIFRHPPQPTQAAARVPIPAQGDAPPRYALPHHVRRPWVGDSFIPPRRPASAAWDVAVVAPEHIPLAAWRWAIWRAWQGDAFAPSRRTGIAPLTLVYGDAPPPAARTLLHVIAQWSDHPPRSQARSALAWNVPPAVIEHVPPSLLPLAIWLAWHREHASPPRARAIAPLTLVYGDAPPPRLLSAPWQILTQWLGPDWRAQAPAPTAAWNIPPVVPGDTPPPRLLQWQVLAKYFEVSWPAQRHAPNAAWNLAPVTPADRIVYVRLDDRTVLVLADDRVIDILLDDRNIKFH